MHVGTACHESLGLGPCVFLIANIFDNTLSPRLDDGTSGVHDERHRSHASGVRCAANCTRVHEKSTWRVSVRWYWKVLLVVVFRTDTSFLVTSEVQYSQYDIFLWQWTCSSLQLKHLYQVQIKMLFSVDISSCRSIPGTMRIGGRFLKSV